MAVQHTRSAAAAGDGSDVLGPEHDAQARRMTRAAATALVVAVAALMLVTAPFMLALPIILAVYVALEAVFAVLYWYRFALLSYQPIKHRPLSHDPIAALQRTLTHLQQSGADIRAFLSIWFHGAPIESIRRGNVKDLIAYAFWYKTPAEVAAEGRDAELDQQVSAIESTWGLSLAPGYDPQLTCMAHLWEPMKHWYKPLAFYAVMEVAALLCRIALQAAGFQRHVWMGLAYYTTNMPAQPPIRHSIDVPAGPHAARSSSSSSSSSSWRDWQAAAMPAQQQQQQHRGSSAQQQVPLVLLHGIGMGLIPYISMLFNMAATGRPVLALEMPHVSQRWVLWVPTVDEAAEVLLSTLNRNDISACCLVGHSYGSAVASRLLQQAPQRIQQLCLIDPICFAMHMPTLLRNFMYEWPGSGSWLGDFMMISAARDLHVSATLSRRFFWSDVNLWEEQIPADTLVVLSGRDALMAAPQVRSWLEDHTDAVVMYHPDLAHAAFLLDIAWQQQILQQLLLLLDNTQTPANHHKPSSQRPPHDEHGGVQVAGSQQSDGSHRHALHSSQAGADSAPFAGAGAAGLSGHSACSAQGQWASSCSSSCDGSAHSYVSCQEQDDSGPLHPGTVTSQAKGLDASPFSAACQLDRSSARSSAGGMLSSCTSGRFSSSGSLNSTNHLQPAQYLARSGDSSLELASSLCMRSWSGVLPCASVTDASAASDSGQPESPRSWNTFVSASSVQSRCSLAATTAAQQAQQAAQMLLQPLLALQQRGGSKAQADGKQAADRDTGDLRRVTWGSSASGEAFAPPKSAGAGARVECMVSFRSCASDDKDCKQQQEPELPVAPAAAAAAAAADVSPAGGVGEMADAAEPVQVAVPSAEALKGPGRGSKELKLRPAAATAGHRVGGTQGVWKRVERLWQGRGGAQGTPGRSGTHS